MPRILKGIYIQTMAKVISKGINGFAICSCSCLLRGVAKTTSASDVYVDASGMKKRF